MAGLIEASLVQSAQLEGKENLTAELPTIPHSIEPYTLPTEGFLDDEGSMLEKGKRAIYEHCGTALAAVREWPVLRQPGLLAKGMVQRAKEVTWHKPPLSVTLAAVATVLMLTFWVASGGGRGPVSSLGSSASSESAAARRQGSLQPKNAIQAEGTNGQSASVSVKEQRRARTKIRRVRAGQSEVDYIGDDVTVRHFSYKAAPQRRAVGASRVTYIGEDVTVRYFTPKPPVKSASR